MSRVELRAVGAGLLAAISTIGAAKAVLEAAGIRATPQLIAAAAVAGIGFWLSLAAIHSHLARKNWNSSLRLTGWGMAPGLISWIALWPCRLTPSTFFLSFSEIGLLRIGNQWTPIDAENYLRLGIAGMGIAGILIAQATIFWRNTGFPFASAAIALLLIGSWRILVFPPSGDEPYILMSTLSLLQDGEMDLRDDFAGETSMQIRPHSFGDDFMAAHRVDGSEGELYSRHGMLLPVIFLPGYAVQGRLGLHALLAGTWGLLLAMIYRLLVSAGRPKNLALTVTALFAIASPLPVFAVFMGPDLPCALLLTMAAVALFERRLAATLACVAVLPWLHHKAVLPAAGMAIGAAVFRSSKWGIACSVALGISLSLMLWAIAAFTDIPAWPPWSVISFSSISYQEGFSITNAPASFLGTLFDRYQGILHYPALLLVFAGFAILATRNSRRHALFLLCCAGPYLTLLLLYNQWHGGPGAPGRLLVLILPLAALPLAAAAEELLKKNWGKILMGGIFALGAGYNWLMAGIPALAFVSAKRRIEHAILAFTGINPLSVLPEFAEPQPSRASYFKALILLVFLAAFSVLVVGLKSRNRLRRAIRRR